MTDDSSEDEEDNRFVNSPGASLPPPSSLPADDLKAHLHKLSKAADDKPPANGSPEHLNARIKPSTGPSGWHWHEVGLFFVLLVP